jgi:hypothetical protein
MKKLLLSLFVLTATLGAGFWFGRITSSHTRGTSFDARDTSSHAPYAVAPLQTSERTAQAGGAYPSAGPMQKPSVEQIAARLRSECQRGIWRRTKEWEVIFNSLTPAEVGRLMSAVRDLVLVPAQEELRRALFSRWAEDDPAAALAFARGLPESALRDATILSVVQGWFYTSPEEAAAWIRQLPPGALKNELLNHAVRYLAAKDPNAALALGCARPARGAQVGRRPRRRS